MLVRWMTEPVFQRNDRHLAEVVLRQLHFPAIDRDHVLSVKLVRASVGPMALQTESVGVSHSQQVRIVAAVRLVARGASLLGRWLMWMFFLELFRLIGMARQASIDGIGL